MFYYYLGLALRSLRHNSTLTALVIATIGIGIGAWATTLTVFRAMAADPIPEKSSGVFALQIDTWGAGRSAVEITDPQISYIDALGLMKARLAKRQAAMYATGAVLAPSNPQLLALQVELRATFRDFFSMFNVPFLYGAPWKAADDAEHARVVVITRELNDKLFGGGNSVGETITLDNDVYRVAGVLDKWQPLPKFYDLNNSKFGKSESVFLPFTRAIEAQMESWGNTRCPSDVGEGWEGKLNSECTWIQFWVELPDPATAAVYRAALSNYAVEQQRSGRFHWQPRVRLLDVHEWLTFEHVVSDEIHILVLVSFGFLIVCLLNAIGLMLAKIMGRTEDISVRRALGADRGAVFAQYFVETAVLGALGALLGLALTVLGLAGLRSLLSEDLSRLTHIDSTDVAHAMVSGMLATMFAGLYPTWRATQVQPALQLKAQ